MKMFSSNWRFVLVGALLVVAIVCATCLIISAQLNASIEAYRIATNNLGVGMARQTTRSLGLVDQLLRDLAKDVTATSNATPELVSTAMRDSKTTATLLDKGSVTTGIETLLLVDSKGGIAAESIGSPTPNLSAEEKEAFAYFAANDDRGAFVGRPLQTEGSGEWTVAMGRRVNTSDGQFAGIILAALSLSEWQEFYKVAMPPNRLVTLARRDGTILVQYPSGANAAGTLVQNLAFWREGVAKGGGAYLSDGGSGRAVVIASLNPLPDLPFVVEATVLESYALADWYRQRFLFAAGGGAAIVVVVLLLWLFAAQYRRIQFSEAALAKQNGELVITREQLRAALSNISQGVCFFDRDQKLLVANARYAEIYDLPPGAIRPGVSLQKIVEARAAAGSAPMSLAEQHLERVNALAGTTDAAHYTDELRNGRFISVRLQPMPEGGWVATHEDVTGRREAESKLAFLATHDVLTGVANRALLQERIERAQIAAKQGESFALLFLDLDGFKAVNDVLGHQAGDELLHAVAKRLLACVREGDTVARPGGDEFAVLLQNPATAGDAAKLADRILEKLDEAFHINGREVSVGTSIGIAVAPRDGTSVEALVRCVDTALYVAKAEGRGQFRFFQSQMDEGGPSYPQRAVT
jgi:diguanylate cyclase (GGDEF)-like protein